MPACCLLPAACCLPAEIDAPVLRTCCCRGLLWSVGVTSSPALFATFDSHLPNAKGGTAGVAEGTAASRWSAGMYGNI
jgi:hypothetical protein